MTGARDRGIVEAAASLTNAVELSSVAEGVESADQAMPFPKRSNTV
jgi:EAL domain-containing protein (putative c-di-GMP-specific phosphodiesterase class I)